MKHLKSFNDMNEARYTPSRYNSFRSDTTPDRSITPPEDEMTDDESKEELYNYLNTTDHFHHRELDEFIDEFEDVLADAQDHFGGSNYMFIPSDSKEYGMYVTPDDEYPVNRPDAFEYFVDTPQGELSGVVVLEK